MTGASRVYYYFLVVFTFWLGNTAYGQEIFQTKGGEVTINLGYENAPATRWQSDKLRVQLDYDNALLTAVLPLNTLINTANEGQP